MYLHCLNGPAALPRQQGQAIGAGGAGSHVVIAKRGALIAKLAAGIADFDSLCVRSHSAGTRLALPSAITAYAAAKLVHVLLSRFIIWYDPVVRGDGQGKTVPKLR